MIERYYKIEKIIRDWFSFKCDLGINDIMPEVVFLFEQNKELRKRIADLKEEKNIEK
ncbi:MAG: hypothetical protein U0L58_04940 [Ruminococcus sp.]|nr:hypothetical protein [Ruminococcus sp.]MEE0856624.1 hypothetical protein [Ruminococcus sp.]